MIWAKVQAGISPRRQSSEVVISPDDDDKDGPRNVGLFASELTDAAASPRILYATLMLFRFYADP